MSPLSIERHVALSKAQTCLSTPKRILSQNSPLREEGTACGEVCEAAFSAAFISLCHFTLCFFPFSDSTLPTTAVLFHFFGVPVICHRFRSSDMSLFPKLKHV